MLGACLGVFAAFSVLGLFSSLVPTFLHGILGVHNLALVGGASFLIFVTAAVSQAVSAGLPSRRSVSAGLPLLLVCLAALESALFAEALWLFLVATVVGGVAVGFIFRGGLSELNRLAEPRRRAAVVSTFFVAAYLGLGLPAVLTGLISLPVGAVDASAYVSGLVAAIVVVAFVVVLRTFGAVPAPKPPCTPSDSWCYPEEPATATAAARRAGNGAITRWLSTSSAPGAAAGDMTLEITARMAQTRRSGAVPNSERYRAVLCSLENSSPLARPPDYDQSSARRDHQASAAVIAPSASRMLSPTSPAVAAQCRGTRARARGAIGTRRESTVPEPCFRRRRAVVAARAIRRSVRPGAGCPRCRTAAP